MPEARAARGRPAAAAALAFAAGCLLYLPTARHGFVFDDLKIVASNPLARDPAALGAIFTSHYWAGTESLGNLYRPITIWSFALNHALTGPEPWGYHVANALLHGIVSALVVLLGSALGLGAGGALAAGLLFAAHPVHVEAVAPVVGRSEILAAMFCLAAWLCHLRAAGSGRRPPSAGPPGAAWVAASSALFALGLLSKENAAVLPALVLAGDLARRRAAASPAPGGGARKTSAASIGLMGAVLLGWLAARSAILPVLPPEDPMGSVFGGVGPLTRVLTAFGVLGRYLSLMGFPAHLSADYSFRQIPLIESPAEALFLASLLAHAGLAAAGLILAARGRLSGIGILIYLWALLPVSNIPFSIGTVMAERLLYLPSAGLCLLAPALWAEARPRPGMAAGRAAAGLLAVACALLAARTLARIPDWRDQRTLFEATVRTSPASAKAHYNLGVALEEAGNLEAAVESYRRAVAIKPDMAEARRNLGLALLAGSRFDEAIEHLGAAARLDPNIPDVHGDLGVAMHRTGRLAEAEAAFRTEARLHPESARARYNLGSLLLEWGRAEEAAGELLRAAALDPADPDARFQAGVALARLGRHAEAMSAFGQALRLSPSLVEALLPLARSALAAGRPDVAREALGRAGAAGLEIPEDLRAASR